MKISSRQSRGHRLACPFVTKNVLEIHSCLLKGMFKQNSARDYLEFGLITLELISDGCRRFCSTILNNTQKSIQLTRVTAESISPSLNY